MKNIESIRHGDRIKKESGSYGQALSEIGKENAKKKSLDYYREIKESPEGTIFFSVTSDIERAVDTRAAINDKLEDLIDEKDNIEMISVNDLDKIEIAKNDRNKRYIIKDFHPSSLLGLGSFKEDDPNLLLFYKLTKLFNNDSALALKTWITKKNEIEILKNKIKNKDAGKINYNEVNPSDFSNSPEDFIIPYFKFLKRVSEIVDSHFPGRPWKCLQVGHDVQLDLSAMFLLEGEISLSAFEKIKNLRNFLEPSQIDINNDKMIFKFRDLKKEIKTDFNQLIENLKKASKKRKQEWNNNKLV